VLADPFGRQITQAGDPNTAREPSIDRRLDQGRYEKGQCDRPVDLSNAAVFTVGNLLNIVDGSGGEFLQPESPLRDCGDELGARLGADRTLVLTGRSRGWGNDLARSF
jgi:hypothetical protein